MTVEEFFTILSMQLDHGKLDDVCNELKDYYDIVNKNQPLYKEIVKIENTLETVRSSSKYSDKIKDLKKNEVKKKLQNIILSAKEKQNKNKTLPDLFIAKFDLKRLIIEAKTIGDQKLIYRVMKFFITLVVLSIVGSLIYKLNNSNPSITNCDCTEIEQLKIKANDKLQMLKSDINNLNTQINNAKNISDKKKLLEKQRNLQKEADNIKALVLPELNNIARKCPYANCNNKINSIRTSFN